MPGMVFAWGENANGQLGDGTTTGHVTPFNVKDPGSLSSVLSNIKAVSASDHSLALRSDGTVFGWGHNFTGQIGDNTTTNRALPVQVKGLNGVGFLGSIKAISAAGIDLGPLVHSLALGSDGKVFAWGCNSSGQVGNGSTSFSVNAPVQVKGVSGVGFLNNIKAISASFHNLALRSDGAVFAWGSNSAGQLGNDSTVNSATPVQVKGLTVTVSAF